MRKLRKKFTYRDISGRTAQQIKDDWQHYHYLAGPYVCKWHGRWGQVQVWAKDEYDGRRMLRRALTIGGWSEEDMARGVFTCKRANSERNGRFVTMRVAEGRGMIGVSKRPGPNGSPSFAEET